MRDLLIVTILAAIFLAVIHGLGYTKDITLHDCFKIEYGRLVEMEEGDRWYQIKFCEDM